MEKKIFIDTDGILRDFVGACENRFKTIFDWSQGNSIRNHLNMTKEEWEKALDVREFWTTMPLMKDTTKILQIVYKYIPNESVYFVSSSQQTPGAMAGCLEWYKLHFQRALSDGRIILCQKKELLAGHGIVLIDDHAETCRIFLRKGGWSILYPRLLKLI